MQENHEHCRTTEILSIERDDFIIEFLRDVTEGMDEVPAAIAMQHAERLFDRMQSLAAYKSSYCQVLAEEPVINNNLQILPLDQDLLRQDLEKFKAAIFADGQCGDDLEEEINSTDRKGIQVETDAALRPVKQVRDKGAGSEGGSAVLTDLKTQQGGRRKVDSNTSLTPRQQLVLDKIIYIHSIDPDNLSRTKIARSLDIVDVNLAGYLKGLIKRGLIEKKGTGRAARYLPVIAEAVPLEAEPETAEKNVGEPVHIIEQQVIKIICDLSDQGQDIITFDDLDNRISVYKDVISRSLKSLESGKYIEIIGDKDDPDDHIYLPLKRPDGSEYEEAEIVEAGKKPPVSDLALGQQKFLDAICYFYDVSAKPVLMKAIMNRTGKDRDHYAFKKLLENGYISSAEVRRKYITGPVPLGYTPLKRSDGTTYQRDLDIAREATRRINSNPPEVEICKPGYASGYYPEGHLVRPTGRRVW